MATKIIQSASDWVKKLVQDLLALWRGNKKAVNPLTQDQQARIRVQKLIDYYNGNQVQYLLPILDQQFFNTQFLKMQPNIRNIVNYLASIVPMVFKNGVIIQPENGKDEPVWEEILAANKFDSLVQLIDKMTFLCKTCFIKVGWRDEQICLDLVTPELVMVETDELNPYKIKSITYPVKLEQKDLVNSQVRGVFAYWSETEFSYRDEKGTLLPNPENPDNINPYAPVIPFVTFQEAEPTHGQFFEWPGDELINAQDNLNVKLTQRNYLLKRFSVPVPVLTNASMDNGNVIIADGSTVISVTTDKESGSKAGFEWVSAQADLAKMNESINDEFRTLLLMYGIDPNTLVPSADKQSAEAIIKGHQRIDERRVAAKAIYQYSLEELMDVIRYIYNIHVPNGLSEDEVRVKILESPTTYPSMSDKWLDITNRLKFNFDSPASILLEMRNDLDSLQEAQEVIDANAQANASTGPRSIIEGFLQQAGEEKSLSGV